LSLHAAGIVLSDQDLIKAAPLVNVSGQWAVQYTMEYLEELGLIKIDLLGLRNLTICAQINSRLDKPLNLWKMAPDDPAAYRLLSQGDTLGVFQLEKEGIRQLLRRMQPHTFADIAIVLALYRPGPMQEIDTYLKNRAHPESIDWLHPSLRPILEETYGVMIYQEQIMQAAVAAGGFTLAEADILRKAMSKKNKDVMDSYRTKFLEGAKEKGIGQETANRIFDLMEKFSGYGFNKAHSYAYGRIAYVMAYLKANHPLIFYQCVLEGTLGSAVKTGQYLSECRRRGIQILPADLRLSQGEYVIEGNALRLPLTLLKGIGKALMPRLEAARALDLSGPVQTIASLWASKVTEAQILTLIDGGALDWLGESRLTLRDNLPKISDYAHIVRVEKEGMLFDYSIVSMPNLVKKKENVLERSVREKEAYGFYVSEHPVQALRKERFAQVPLISRIEEVSGYVQLIGRVADFHTHKTKKGDMMAFAVLEDESGQIDLAVMPRLLAEKRELLAEGSLVFIKGKKDRPNSVLVNQMEKIELEAS
jgi:DNA polymerase-3 subunit alpha